MVTKKYIKLLESNINALSEEIVELKGRVDKLEKDSRDENLQFTRVAYALQAVLEKNTAIKIVHELDGQKVTTKLIRDKRKELAEQKRKLEWALQSTKEALGEMNEERA